MLNFRDYVFVLWADQFEEATATIFVTELREAGLRVKVVGLTLQQISGSHGLALVPDLSLDQALPLATSAMAVIIPCASRGIKRLKNDPRLHSFFYQAYSNQAKFVLDPLNETDLLQVGLFPVSADKMIAYPGNEDLVEFVRSLAGSLSRDN